MPKSTRLACPICGKENDYFAPPLGPFCSDRCKLIDLGRWLGGKYQIPVAEEDVDDTAPRHVATDDADA